MAGETVLAKLAVLISANAAQFTGAVNQVQGQMKGLQNSLNSANKLFNAFGVGFSALAVLQGVKAVVGVMSEFESTMSEVKAITGATGDEFEKLRKSAIDLGASTKFSATEVGKLQISLGRLGFSTAEILNATEATLALAAATGEDLAKAADTAGSTVRGFGLDAKETQRVVDVMAKSFNVSALGLDNFTESMKYVAPIAQAANISVEETTALLAVLADAGIRGSSAGTALRKIFGDLSKDGRPVADRLNELGKKGIGLSDAFDEVGRTAQTALLVLTKNREKADDLTASFQNVNGEAERMARIMQDNLAGDVEKLSSAWEGLILSFSKTDVFRRVTQDITAFLDSIRGSTNADTAFRNLAEAIKRGASTSDLEHFTEVLKKARIEAGKPFDADSLATEVGEKYGLAEKQINQFYEAILSVNNAMGFQEKAIKEFSDFVSRNGYKDLSKAADDYKDKLYALILAEQIRKQGLEQAASVPGGEQVFAKSIQASNDQISAYRRAIGVINEYVDANTIVKDSNDKVADSIGKVAEANKANLTTLAGLKETLNQLNKEFDKTAVTDQTSLRATSARIEAIELLISRLEKVKSLGSGEQFLPPINSDALFKSLDIDQGLIDRFKERMKQVVDTAKGTSNEVKTAFEGIDLSGLLSNALAGIGEAFGQALAGTDSLGKLLLGVLGGILKQFGGMLITVGVGLIAVKKAFQSLNGYVAIAAGVALVALGAYFSSATKGIGNSMGGGGGGGGSSSGSGVERIARNQPFGDDIKFDANFYIRGNDLQATGKNQDYRNGRLGG